MGETLTVLWAGARHQATVVRRFKNGKVCVQIGLDRNLGSRPGSTSGATIVTVEEWQIVKEPVMQK